MLTFKRFISEEWHDSAAKDANGRWAKYRDGKIGIEAMATWLFNSRAQKDKAGKLKSCYGAIAQQENTSKLISKSQADKLRAAVKRKYGMKLQELFVREEAAEDEIVVKMHKAFPGKVQAAKAELEKVHNAGKQIKTSQSGDYVNLHVPKSQHNNAASVEKTMQSGGHSDHHAYGGVHQNGQRVTEGRVKDAMIELVEKAIDKVTGESELTYEDDKNEFCMAVAKKVIDMDNNELFAGNRSAAYEWVKDYLQDM